VRRRVLDLSARRMTAPSEVIEADAQDVAPPDLHAIAQSASEPDLVALVSLVLTLCVQSDKVCSHLR
jgi:hypothetical protein